MSTRSSELDESFEVYEHEAGGWAVRRVGEVQALSHHDSREQAEKAARLHSDEGIEVDLRQDIFTNDPEQAVRPRRAFLLAAVAAVSVIALLAVVSLIVALT